MSAEMTTVASTTTFIRRFYFSLLALAESAGIDAGAALAGSLEKYESRLAEGGSAGSGE